MIMATATIGEVWEPSRQRRRRRRRLLCRLSIFLLWISVTIVWVPVRVARAEQEDPTAIIIEEEVVVKEEEPPILLDDEADSNSDSRPRATSSSSSNNNNCHSKNDPFFIVSTVDGSIGVLKALDGSLVGGFRSGTPLVGPSEILSGGRRIVPGLDGRLYISLEHQEGLLQPLEITVVDVLQTPVKTCSGGGSSCGIVTATKSTSLFAIDAHTGRLVWKQSPNGTTIVEDTSSGGDDDDDNAVTSTVLLQREDVLVQQLSTDSGKSVWNVTLGTVQALEFGEGSGGSDGSSLPSHHHGGGGPYLPSGLAAESREVLMQDFYRPVELPSVIFGPDGTSLIAVSSSSDGDIQVLWKRDFSTVVASVFGLQDKTWKPLTVLEDPESSAGGANGGSDGDSTMPPQLGADASSSTSSNKNNSPKLLTVYRPPILQQLFSYWAKPMSLLDRLADDWFYATGQQQQQQHPRRQASSSRFWSSVGRSTSSQVVAPKRHTLAPLLEHHDLFAPPNQQHQYQYYHHTDHRNNRLALPSSPFNSVDDFPRQQNGVFLTWPILVGICIVVVGAAALVFRYLYLQKKSKWVQLLQQMARVGLVGDKSTQNMMNEDSSGNNNRNDPNAISTTPTLKRSHSLPDVAASGSNIGGVNKLAIQRRLRSDSLHISHTVDGRVVYESGENKNATTSTTAGNTSNNNSTPQQEQQQPQQQPQGVDFLVDGIPLIRYNRYDSEFSEVVALGKGGFGTVFRCKNVLDGREYAIKKVALRYKEGLPLEEFRQRLQRTLREVKSLALLDHPNIVRYYTAWLELHQQNDQDDGRTRGSQSLADSDYYLFSPDDGATTTNTKSRRHPGAYSPLGATHQLLQEQQQKQRRPSLGDRHYLRHGYNNASNPLGGWDHDLDDITGDQSFHHLLPGVPAALDDYGFTFDRGDEDTETGVENTATPDELTVATKKALKTKATAVEEKSKSLGFLPHGPIVHRYSSNYSSHSEESSIEGSTSHTGGWSRDSRNQTIRHESMTGTSTDDRENQLATQSKNSSATPALMVKHTLYIQMQFCSQKTLADFLNNPDTRKGGETSGGIDIPYALSLFVQIAQGVQHVHSQGLIHRDLKPNNCFMDDSGVVKVGDFGLSRESANDNREDLEPLDELVEEEMELEGKAGGASSFREITAGVGTRSYASPEQMQGSDYDSSTDIYSLGIMLFELCYPMYTGMERTIVLSKLRNHIFPEQWMENVERAFPTLHSLLQSMISNSPADRPTAVVVVRSIQTILEGFTISSIDKHHHENAILLRVEAKPREDVLRHTINLVKEAASPDCIEIVQYGLRGGTNKAVMEFAVSSSTCKDQSSLGNTLVNRLGRCDEVLLIRQVSGTKYTFSQ